MKINPEEYKQYISEIKTDVVLDEVELKALLAYLNSTFNWVWIEQSSRRTGGGIIALEPKTVVERMPILNVKAIDRGDVEELAKLFDELEGEARKLVASMSKAKKREKSEEGEIGGPKLEMIKRLRPIFRKIDEKIAKILGIDIDIDMLWERAWQMMERRVTGTREVVRPGASSEDIAIRTRERRRRRRRESGGSMKTLDEFLEAS